MNDKDDNHESEGFNSKKRASVIAQSNLLLQTIKAPDGLDATLSESLLKSLTSQGGMAAFEWLPLGIIGMALNTHKAIANQILDGGFQAFNEQRKDALESLRKFQERAKNPSRGTIEWYKSELEAKDEEIKRMRDDLVTMSEQIRSVMEFAHDLAIASNKTEQFATYQINLLKKFSRLTRYAER